MATVTKENIGLLHEKLTVKLEKQDYLPSFEKALKDYSKKANIPGFRKGMVPAGLIKKMYGPSLFTDEVLRSVDRELIGYLQNDKLDIFAQPLPLDADIRQLDVNNPADYTFHFEVGMKPEFALTDLGSAKIDRFVVDVTDEMINNEIARLQNRYGNMQDQDSVATEENVLNVVFSEVDENANEVEGGIHKDNSLLVKYFKEDFRPNLIGKNVNDFVVVELKKAFDEKELDFILSDLGLDKNDPASAEKHFRIQITKIGLLEKRELNEEFFNQLYPNGDVKSEADFRNKIKEEIQAYWNSQARNQIHDQLFHQLTDHTSIKFPESFLKKWIKTQGSEGEDAEKTDEQVEKEFPTFLNQLKWTLITDKIVQENGVQVNPDEIREFAKQQLLGYMGGMGAGVEDQPWVSDYIEKMMKDRKYVEDAYNRIQTQKVFEWAETKINPTDKPISAEDFTKMVEDHQHHHHH
ncbi:MAG: trigger factor [Sphingobacteriales bacterium]|nr:trigger factor [Sphingobacteriales bacterium]OJW02187.1 MAG: trigger factor [Sphingobacteriales bacterium 44-61]